MTTGKLIRRVENARAERPAAPARLHEHAHAHAHGAPGLLHGGHDHDPDHAKEAPQGERATRDRRGGHAASSQRRLALVIAFGSVVLVAEVIGGFLANSLALWSDAVHMSTDVAAVALAYGAMRLAARPPSSAKSYGYYRAEVVAAFVNALVLWVIAGYFVFEAWRRLLAPPEVDGPIVLVVGAVSLAANLVMAALLHGAHAHSLNVRSAYLHVLSDALGSLAAVAVGLGVMLYGATWLDPAATLFISALVVVWTWRLTRETLHVLLEGTPVSVKPDEVKAAIEAVPGVVAVHDLHVWSLTTGVDNLSAHVRVQDPTQGPAIVRAIRERLHERYGLSHLTIEVEADDDCVGCN